MGFLVSSNNWVSDIWWVRLSLTINAKLYFSENCKKLEKNWIIHFITADNTNSFWLGIESIEHSWIESQLEKKSRTTRCVMNSFIATICLLVGINTSTIGSRKTSISSSSIIIITIFDVRYFNYTKITNHSIVIVNFLSWRRHFFWHFYLTKPPFITQQSAIIQLYVSGMLQLYICYICIIYI